MSAWDDAVNREFVAKLKAKAEAYPDEFALLADLENFGGDVYVLLTETDELEFGKGNDESI